MYLHGRALEGRPARLYYAFPEDQALTAVAKPYWFDAAGGVADRSPTSWPPCPGGALVEVELHRPRTPYLPPPFPAPDDTTAPTTAATVSPAASLSWLAPRRRGGVPAVGRRRRRSSASRRSTPASRNATGARPRHGRHRPRGGARRYLRSRPRASTTSPTSPSTVSVTQEPPKTLDGTDRPHTSGGARGLPAAAVRDLAAQREAGRSWLTSSAPTRCRAWRNVNVSASSSEPAAPADIVIDGGDGVGAGNQGRRRPRPDVHRDRHRDGQRWERHDGARLVRRSAPSRRPEMRRDMPAT